MLILGFMGIGDAIFSEGIKQGVQRLGEKYGAAHQTFTHRARKAPERLIKRHQGEQIILVGHSAGVDAIDDILEASGLSVSSVFAVASAYPETFPKGAGTVYRVIGKRDWRRFTIKGGEVVHTHVLDASHVRIDNSELLWELVESEISMSSEWKITPRMAIEVASHEGLVLEAYKDSVGVWTWSMGITSASGHRVERYIGKPTDVYRAVEVYIWLLATKYFPTVQKAFKGRDLSEAQMAAALSFHWNTGAIQRATWVENFLAGEIDQARANFMAWRKPPEIIERRGKERDLFFDGEWIGNGTVTHWTTVRANGSIDWSKSKRINISDLITEAVEAHYAPELPKVIEPEKPIVEAPVGDMESLPTEVLLSASQDTLDRLKQVISELERRSNQLTPPTSPAIERGSSYVEKENIMARKSLFKSKTFWGIVGMFAATAFPPAAPIIDVLTGGASVEPAAQESVSEVANALNVLIQAALAAFATYGRMDAKGPATLSGD